jgi:acyl carrier protein
MNTMTHHDEAHPPEALVREICAHLAPLNRQGLELNAETDIAADLEIDSVSVMDLVMSIEDAYDIMIPMNQLSQVRTVGDLATAVDSLIKKS